MLVVATTNRNKVREIQALLEGVDVNLVSLDRWRDVPPPEETGRTFEDNARLKALYYAQATGELVVAEDSGLEIDALGGAPGVESARYGGDIDYPQKFALIEQALAAARSSDRRARFACAVSLARGRDILFETRGTVEGRIAPAPQGRGGFGYDPIFFYPPYGCTFGDATPGQKAAVSHRGVAFRAVKAFLEQSRL